MKRFVLSLVTALSLMGAAQAFAVPVPVVKELNFKNYSTGALSATGSFNSLALYSEPILTKDLANPLSHISRTPAASAGFDSIAIATLRVFPAAGSSPSTSDSLAIALQVSANGSDWVTWTPVVGTITTSSLIIGTNKMMVVLDDNAGGHDFYLQLRADDAAGWHVRELDGLTGTSAAEITEAGGWMQYPLIRFAFGGRTSQLDGATMQMQFRHYKEVPGVIVPDENAVMFRTTGGAVPVDSSFASGVGASTSGASSTTPDTTVAVSADDWVLPYRPGMVADSIGYAALIITTTSSDGNTPDAGDTTFVQVQYSFGNNVWISAGTNYSLLKGPGNAFVLPFYAALVPTAVGCCDNGALMLARSGTAAVVNRMYGLAPMVRFIIRRDSEGNGALKATIRRFVVKEG